MDIIASPANIAKIEIGAIPPPPKTMYFLKLKYLHLL